MKFDIRPKYKVLLEQTAIYRDEVQRYESVIQKTADIQDTIEAYKKKIVEIVIFFKRNLNDRFVIDADRTPLDAFSFQNAPELDYEKWTQPAYWNALNGELNDPAVGGRAIKISDISIRKINMTLKPASDYYTGKYDEYTLNSEEIYGIDFKWDTIKTTTNRAYYNANAGEDFKAIKDFMNANKSYLQPLFEETHFLRMKIKNTNRDCQNEINDTLKQLKVAFAKNLARVLKHKDLATGNSVLTYVDNFYYGYIGSEKKDGYSSVFDIADFEMINNVHHQLKMILYHESIAE